MGGHLKGQRAVLASHYARVQEAPVAFVDETYSLEAGRRRFYVLTSVVVAGPDRDALRRELDSHVPGGYWHTTDKLQQPGGREEALKLLRLLQPPENICVIVHKTEFEADDRDGLAARGAALATLLVALNRAEAGTHEPVNVVVMEAHREARVNNHDRSVRARLIEHKQIDQRMQLVAVSPGSEHLLWLPDVVCSAYRQSLIFDKRDLFDAVEDITTVIK